MVALSGVRETSMARDNAMNVALQFGAPSLQIVLLQCSKLRRCDVASYDAAAL